MHHSIQNNALINLVDACDLPRFLSPYSDGGNDHKDVRISQRSHNSLYLGVSSTLFQFLPNQVFVSQSLLKKHEEIEDCLVILLFLLVTIYQL